MRTLSLILVTCVSSPVACFAAEPEAVAAEPEPPVPGVHASPEALAESVRAAFTARDAAAWQANVVLTGVSEADRATLADTLRKIFAVKPEVRSVTVDTLPDGFDWVYVADGRKCTLTVAPCGMIHLRLAAGNSETEIPLPYGRVGDGFKLGTPRSEPLNWKGPADVPFLVEVRHSGDADEVGARIRYNASGVTLERRFSGRGRRVTLLAQHIESVEVERSGDGGETVLEITRRGAGAPVVLFRSEPLKAPGKIVFERDQDTPAAEPEPAAPMVAPAGKPAV